MEFERYYLDLFEMLNSLCKKIASGKYDQSVPQPVLPCFFRSPPNVNIIKAQLLVIGYEYQGFCLDAAISFFKRIEYFIRKRFKKLRGNLELSMGRAGNPFGNG